jgi:hypothetical protein
VVKLPDAMQVVAHIEEIGEPHRHELISHLLGEPPDKKLIAGPAKAAAAPAEKEKAASAPTPP